MDYRQKPQHLKYQQPLLTALRSSAMIFIRDTRRKICADQIETERKLQNMQSYEILKVDSSNREIVNAFIVQHWYDTHGHSR